MQKLLKILGVVFIVEHVILIGAFLALGLSNAGTQKEAEDYVNQTVKEVFRDFKLEELEPEISSAWREKWPQEKDQIEDTMQTLRDKMGGLVEVKEVNGQTTSSASVKGGKATIGNFSVLGTFENGEGRILVKVIKEGDHWKLNSFTIHSTLLDIK